MIPHPNDFAAIQLTIFELTRSVQAITTPINLLDPLDPTTFNSTYNSASTPVATTIASTVKPSSRAALARQALQDDEAAKQSNC